jgi:hypothetical protein
MRRDEKKKTVFAESNSYAMRRRDEKQSRDGKKKIAFEENSNCERMRLVESRKTVGRHCFAWRKQHVKKKSAAVRKTNGVAKSCNGSRTRPASSWISNAWLGLRTNVVVNNKRLRHARLEKQKIGSVSNG